MQINRHISTQLATCVAFLCIGYPLSGQARAQRTLAIRGATIETASDKGTLLDATILIKDGKIEAVGPDVKIPVAARVIDATGKTIMPGIVDPYFVVTIGRNTAAATTRTVVFNGRVFTIGGGPPSIATTFAKLADGLDPMAVNWQPAIRSGITTLHVVAGGYAQSLLAAPSTGSNSSADVNVLDMDGKILVTVSNDTKSLDVLRKNIGLASSPGRSTGTRSTGTRSTGTRSAATASSTPAASASSSPNGAMWSAIRDGKSPVFVNVNSASAILHAEAVLAEYPKAKIALIANGPNVLQTLDSIDPKRYTIILPPAIDRVPNSANRVSVARSLVDKGVPVAFSLSLSQSDFRDLQSTPLFGAAMLIRSGLDRQATIRSLTIEPAKLIGLDEEVGSLEPGKEANLLVFGEDPFSATASIEQVYVSGEQVNE